MRRLLLGLIVILAFLAGAATVALRMSLPLLDGEHELAGLTSAVSIERDANGVVTVRGRTRLDVARATGFAHAQDRFFQMDLLRRVAAGEIAELFGSAAIDHDRRRRLHGLRGVAEAAVTGLTPGERALLGAYVDGVNAGIARLPAPPPEYLLLRDTPRPWRAEDTLLAVLGMYLQLSDGDAMTEMRRGLLYQCLPDPVAAFLASPDPDWAAPVDGGALPRVAMPAANVFDLRALDGLDLDTGRTVAQTLALDTDLPGGASNAWVVAGTRTRHGHALVANDMHLALRMPNVWYRMRLVVEGGTEPELDVSGVTLPGTPAVVAGSNGHIAWGFTNSYGDWSDRVRVSPDPNDENSYLTPDGPRPYRLREETIRVRGGEDVVEPVRETLWGPVTPDPLRGAVAIRWLGHLPEAVNLRLLDLERATSVADALAIAPLLGIPPQNLNVGDRDGHIGWTIAGRIPLRAHYDSGLPSDGAAGQQGWLGWLPAADYPRIVDPPGGLIWTANHPVVTGAALALIGDSGYAHGARALQIRDALRAIEPATETDMLRIQLDDRGLLLERWRTLLVSLLATPGVSAHARAAEFRAALAGGELRADVASVDYRLTWSFRRRLRDVVFSAITAPCHATLPGYRFEGFRQEEGALWQLVTERPAHLLHPRFQDWDALLASVALEVIDHFAYEFQGPIAERTWGEHNTLTMRHPLSRALEVLAPWLDVGPTPAAGDRNLPRVLAHDDGASQRFAVAPGRESEAILHLPGGQSGHPLSPSYRAGHEAWLNGEPSPFLPGRTVHELRLSPATPTH